MKLLQKSNAFVFTCKSILFTFLLIDFQLEITSNGSCILNSIFVALRLRQCDFYSERSGLIEVHKSSWFKKQ